MTQKQARKNDSPSRDSRSTKRLAFTRPVVSKEQILASGERAAELLNSPVYNLAVNSVVEDLGMEMLGTEPHESNRRDWLHAQGAATSRINQKLVEFVQMAQHLQLEAITSEESAQREADFNRGFPDTPGELDS